MTDEWARLKAVYRRLTVEREDRLVVGVDYRLESLELARHSVPPPPSSRHHAHRGRFRSVGPGGLALPALSLRLLLGYARARGDSDGGGGVAQRASALATGGVTAAADRRPARSGLVLATLILGAIVANINTSISNVALPDIGQALNASNQQLTFITDAYQIAIASTVLYLGAVGDRYGRKKLLLLGAALCIPFSILSSMAHGWQGLVAAQMATGVAGGMLYPTTLSLITALFSGQHDDARHRPLDRDRRRRLGVRTAHRRLPAPALLVGLRCSS